MSTSTATDRTPGPFRDEDLLAPSLAAEIAQRSLRTIRRAYASGSLLAYRDGSGRGVRIRYGDLRDWLMREPVFAPPPSPAIERPLGRIDPGRRLREGKPSENLALLNAAREKRRRMRDGDAGRRAAVRLDPPRG